MLPEKIKILIVEDSDADSRLVEEYLKEPAPVFMQVSRCKDLSSALELIQRNIFDIVLLDLGLPDSQGLHTIERMVEAFPALPLIVLTGFDDEQAGFDALYKGAQDYLVKSRIQSELLLKSIRYAIERKQIDGALRESEERYRSLVMFSPEAIIVHSLGKIKFANPSAVKLLRASSEKDIIDKPVISIIPVEYQGEVQKRIEAALRGETPEKRGVSQALDMQVMRLDGTLIDVDATGSRTVYEGNPAIQVILRDISGRKEAEIALYKSETRFKLLSSIASRLLQSEGPQLIIEELCRDAMKILDCQVFFNYIIDELSSRMHLNAFSGISVEEAKRIEWLDYGTAVCGCVARDKERIVANDIQNDPDERTQLVKSYGIKAYCCHPLVAQNMAIGTIFFGSRTKICFSEDDIALMKNISDQVSIAMERIRAKNKLTEREHDLNRAQSVGHIGSWRLDINKNELTWSDENHRIFGLKKDKPMTYETFLSVVHPDDRDYVDKKWNDALKGDYYDIEHRLIVDGKIKWVREKAELEFDKEGRLLGGFGTTQDITNLKEIEQMREFLLEEVRLTEQRLSWALQAGKGGAWELDFKTGIFWLSPETYDLWQVEPGRTINLEEFYSLVDEQDRQFVINSIDTFIKEHVNPQFEFRINDSVRGQRWIDAYARIFYDDKGQAARAIGIFFDITDRKDAEEILKRDKDLLRGMVEEKTAELVRSKMELEKAKRLSDIGSLAAIVAHELRNPLAAINLAVMNVRRKAKDEALESNLINIEKKIKESDSIINNLLFYSRIKSPHYEKINLYDIMDECIGFSVSRSKKNIAVLKKFKELKSYLVEADPLQIKEVFVNILNNACDAVKEEKGMVEVRAKIENGFVEIIFKDNGIGMPKEDLSNVFQPFFTTKSKGTGLGLCVCYQIISLHNGTIAIESALGKGTGVTVRFPLSKQ